MAGCRADDEKLRKIPGKRAISAGRKTGTVGVEKSTEKAAGTPAEGAFGKDHRYAMKVRCTKEHLLAALQSAAAVVPAAAIVVAVGPAATAAADGAGAATAAAAHNIV